MPLSRKLPARRYGALALSVVLSILMTFVVSGVSTLRALGPVPDFVPLWMSAWGMSWVVAFPTLLVVMPPARRLVAAVVAVPGAVSSAEPPRMPARDPA